MHMLSIIATAHDGRRYPYRPKNMQPPLNTIASLREMLLRQVETSLTRHNTTTKMTLEEADPGRLFIVRKDNEIIHQYEVV